VVVDGDSTNEGPLVGYAGIEGSADGVNAVSSGCPANYDESTTGDEVDPAELAEFVAAGGESECDPHTGEPVE
jgi:hypothetical protein